MNTKEYKIKELELEIERVKKEKINAVKIQNWEEAVNLRSLEIKLTEELEELKK
jgi:hypothetical protein